MIQGNKYIKDGKTYWRVTSVIGLLNKPMLLPWAAKCTAIGFENGLSPTEAKKEYKRIGEKAMEYGSAVHHLIENREGIDEDKLLDIPEIENGYLGYLKWKEEMPSIIMEQEQTIYSDKHGFAGTLDMVADIHGQIYLIDFKLSPALYPEQHAMQFAAYREAYKETHGVNLKHTANVRLSKDKIDYDWREYTPAEIKLGWQNFKCLLELQEGLEQWKKLQKK